MTTKLIIYSFFLFAGCQTNTAVSDEETIFLILTHFENTYLHNFSKYSHRDYSVFMNSNPHGVTYIDGAYDEFRITDNEYQMDSIYSYTYEQYLTGTFQFHKSKLPENLHFMKPLVSIEEFCDDTKVNLLICPLTPIKTPFGMEMEVVVLNNQKKTYVSCRMTYSNLHANVTNMEFNSYSISNLRQYSTSKLLEGLLQLHDKGNCFGESEQKAIELDLD